MAGKHFQLIVPNYDLSGSVDRAPVSYLRLGAAFDAGEKTLLSSSDRRGDALISGLAFKDDWRSPGNPNRTYVRDDGVRRTTDSTASTLTGELLTRGGWREHTDGNRISTTRGDCLEVIRGNYKLIILGRIADGWDPEGLGDAGNATVNPNVGRTRQEISGGHYNESTSTPGEVLSITWHQNEDGTWTTLEQTDHGDVKSIYKGWIDEQYFGPSIISTVGCGTSAESIEASKGCATNTSSAGAHDAKKPDITEITYARSQSSTQHITTVEDTTTIRGTGKKDETTHIKSSQIDKTTADTILDLKAHIFFKEDLVTKNHLVKDGFTGWRRNFTFGAAQLNLAAVGFEWTKTKGVGIGLTGAITGSITIVPLQVGLDIAGTLDVRIGQKDGAWLGKQVDWTLGLDLNAAVTKIKSLIVKRYQQLVRTALRAMRQQLIAVNSEG